MAKDMLLDDNMELVIDPTTNDVAFGESKQQEIILILVTEPGEWKHDALVGLGLRKKMKGRMTADELKSDIQAQADYCGMRISDMEVDKMINVFI